MSCLDSCAPASTLLASGIAHGYSSKIYDKAVICMCHGAAAALKEWRPIGLRHFPELHFTYEEESSPEDFFVPYVWTLIVTHTIIPWNSQNIALFAPVGADESAAGLNSQDSASLSAQVSLDARMSFADNL